MRLADALRHRRIASFFFLAQNSLSRPDEAALKQRGKDWAQAQKDKKRGHATGSGSATPVNSGDLEKGSPEAEAPPVSVGRKSESTLESGEGEKKVGT